MVDSKHRKVVAQVRDAVRLKQYADRTEETYILWIRQYIFFHNKRHPAEMGRAEVEAIHSPIVPPKPPKDYLLKY